VSSKTNPELDKSVRIPPYPETGLKGLLAVDPDSGPEDNDQDGRDRQRG
jgi:hypothetical protein